MQPGRQIPESEHFEPRVGRSVSIEQAAHLLGVSRRTVYNRIRDGRLRTIRTLGGSQRVLTTSLDEIRRPVLSRVHGPVLSRVEGPALSGIAGPAFRSVERPALSGVEGHALSRVEGPTTQLVGKAGLAGAGLFSPTNLAALKGRHLRQVT